MSDDPTRNAGIVWMGGGGGGHFGLELGSDQGN